MDTGHAATMPVGHVTDRATAREEVRDRASRVKADISDASRQLRQSANDVKTDLGELAGATGHLAQEQFEPVWAYIRRKPLKSLLIAAGVGALFGVFMRRS